MRKRFGLRTLAGLTTVVALAAVFVAVAGAFNSPGKPTKTGVDTITWTGQGVKGGSLGSIECDASHTPYLLWVLAPSGTVTVNGSTPVLTLGGTGSGSYYAGDGSNSSSVHFLTPYFDPSGLTASASMTILTLKNGTWNLVISHGCPTPKDLTVSKTATPSFTRTFPWTIDKSATPETVYSAGGGTSDQTMYTVAVTKGDPVDSAFAVSGTITVHNPNPYAVNGVSLVDGSCVVSPASVDVAANADATATYTCSFAGNPGSGTNSATATWPDIGSPNTSATATADYAFGDPTSIVDDEIDVTDTNGQSWHFAASGSQSYPMTFSGDPAGTCTPHENTATITQTGQTDSATVTDCQGADPTVTKTASASWSRSYAWTIDKAVDQHHVVSGTDVTFNYTVTVTHGDAVDGDFAVAGTITVANANDWQSVVANVTDAGCTVIGGTNVTIPAGGSVELPYSCSLAGAVDGTNTATVTWDAAANHTPNGSASASADYAFGDPVVSDNCITVTDTLGGNLGTACVGDANPTTFTYSHVVAAPAAGMDCAKVDNTATFTTNTTGTTGSDQESVEVCNPGVKAWCSPGYWKNADDAAWALVGASKTDLFNDTVVPGFYANDASVDNPSLWDVLNGPNANYYGGTAGPFGLNAYNATALYLTSLLPDNGSIQYVPDPTMTAGCPINNAGEFPK
jgi:hypothetical protein